MKTWRILPMMIILCALALSACLGPAPSVVYTRVVTAFPTATPIPTMPAAFPIPKRIAQSPLNTNTRLDFETSLPSGEWVRFVLGPAVERTGYVVDITPLEPSVDGAHIEHKVLPDYDGEQWNDVLWVLLPEPAPALRVHVHAYQTASWPVAYEKNLRLEAGVWRGLMICESSQDGAYVIEIDPQRSGPYQGGIERALVQPEFPGAWYDVLRLQAAPDQPMLPVEVRVYRTPDLPVIADFETQLTPGDWVGTRLQASSAQAAYLVEVTPLENSDNQIERFTVQPEFSGQAWYDVLRLLVPAGRPPMRVHVRVYVVVG
ncbi:MAG: hypothetical protein AB1894_11540 [Chloroflexota bacterium]